LGTLDSTTTSYLGTKVELEKRWREEDCDALKEIFNVVIYIKKHPLNIPLFLKT